MHKYSRIKTIGKGAFGEAVLVKHKDDGNLYVSKEIQLTGLSERDLVATQTEIAVLGKVEHPNITRYIESFQEGDVLYIILEYADGGDLHHQIKRQQQAAASGGALLFPEHQIRNWFVQLCLALQHLHSHKILHRDLKARNVFLSKDNQIKLGDFGLSTVLKHTMAQANTLCGTPYYFSPELCRNKPYNSKSDVWALGCILYEMCTLKHAFDATNMKGLMQKILKGCYPPISTCYSPELSGLIKTMLTKDETRRPSVTEILELPFMQLSLKMLYHNCSKRSLEEEKAQQEARRRKAEELMTAVGEAIRGPLPPKAVDPKLLEAREKEVRHMQNANRQDLKAFLKGPPPAEVMQGGQKPVSPLTPASPPQGAGAGAAAGAPPRRPSEILAEPVAIPHNPQNDADNYTQMRLPERQYDTLRRQVERLTVTGGERCQAAREDDVVVDDGVAMPEQGGGAELLHAGSLRGILENELGADVLQKAYDVLQSVTENDNDKEVMQKVNAILGPKAELADAIARLAALEAAQ